MPTHLRIIQISEVSVLSPQALLSRLDAVGEYPPEVRRTFAVQLRDPSLSGRALYAFGHTLRERTRALGAGVVVNDRLDIALALDADGVHLGRRSVTVADARALLGHQRGVSVACHGVDEVVRAASEGADGVLLSPIFASPGKGTPIGVATITEAREALEVRGLRTVIGALGGVNAGNAAACFSAGAGAVAAIRADLTGLLADRCSLQRP